MLSLRVFRNVANKFQGRNFTTKKIGIIGVPFDKGAGTQGTDQGPDALRQSGLIQEIKDISPDIDVKDYGDIAYELVKSNGRIIGNLKNIDDVASCNKALADKVEQVLNDDRMPITLGGCHSIAIGSISGLLRKMTSENLKILWVDAHIDMNTNSTSPTGNMHGMPVSLLVKELRNQWAYVPQLEWCQPQLSLTNFCWVGLRSIDFFERKMMEEHGINYFDMRDIEKNGIHKVIHMALDILNPGNQHNLHVSFDIDALDPMHANSTGTSEPGGLTLREGVYLMEEAHSTGCLKSMDLVEVNPMVGDERDVEHTLKSAKLLIKAAIGNNRSGN